MHVRRASDNEASAQGNMVGGENGSLDCVTITAPVEMARFRLEGCSAQRDEMYGKALRHPRRKFSSPLPLQRPPRDSKTSTTQARSQAHLNIGTPSCTFTRVHGFIGTSLIVMDPVSAFGVGAGVLAFVQAGLKSTKAIHSLLSGIKGGPRIIQQATNSVENLCTVLEQLAQCRVLDGNDSEPLKNCLLACVDDVESFSKELEPLTIQGDERRLGRYWKKVKVALNEKDLERMCSVMAGHASTINLYLNTLQRYVLPRKAIQFQMHDHAHN